MPIQVRGVLVHARSGTELSRVRTEFRLRLPSLSTKAHSSRGADVVMQSSAVVGTFDRASQTNPIPSVSGDTRLPRRSIGTKSQSPYRKRLAQEPHRRYAAKPLILQGPNLRSFPPKNNRFWANSRRTVKTRLDATRYDSKNSQANAGEWKTFGLGRPRRQVSRASGMLFEITPTTEAACSQRAWTQQRRIWRAHVRAIPHSSISSRPGRGYGCEGRRSQMAGSSVPRTQQQKPCRPRSLARL